MSEKHEQKLVVGAVVVRDGSVLLLQRHADEPIYPNMWELPSGKKEFGESCAEALLREVREEAGLEVEVIAPCHVFDYEIRKGDVVRDTSQISYLVTSDAGEPTISNEHQDFAWAAADQDLTGFGMSEETEAAIEAALALLELRSRSAV